MWYNVFVNNKESKKRYFKKVYENAVWTTCACGCGRKIKNRDKYGRNKKFISGHNRRKYLDRRQYKREWNHRNRKSRYAYKMVYYRRRKVELIKYKGGKCQKCPIEYNGKNAALFQFHHRNPEEKDFQLGNQITNHKWEIILKEADKCDLLCANCHSLEDSKEF